MAEGINRRIILRMYHFINYRFTQNNLLFLYRRRARSNKIQFCSESWRPRTHLTMYFNFMELTPSGVANWFPTNSPPSMELESLLLLLLSLSRAGIAQSIQLMPTGWKTEGSELESREGQEFSLLHIVQTGLGIHPASYPRSTRCSFPGGKAAGPWRWQLTSS
jgi:hypothetical protein